jgi:hypothetical protein
MRELRPLATYFGGSIDAPLSDQEFGEVLDSGYIGVVSNTPETFSPAGQARPRFLSTSGTIHGVLSTGQRYCWRAGTRTRTRNAAERIGFSSSHSIVATHCRLAESRPNV